MRLKNRLLTALAALLTLAVAAAALWAPRALFAAQDNALYTTHTAARAGGSLALQPEDLQLVRALRNVEDVNMNGGYWNSYDNSWEPPEDIIWRMHELATPLQSMGMMSEPGANRMLEYLLSYGEYSVSPSHNVSSLGFENLSVYSYMPDVYVGMYLQVEMTTGLLTAAELNAPPEVFDGNTGLDSIMRAYVEYLGLSVFTDWVLLSTGEPRVSENYGDAMYATGLLYSDEAKIAVNAWYSDYRPLDDPDIYGEQGNISLNIWVESYALNPGRPQQWRDEQGLLQSELEVIEGASSIA